MEKLTVEIDNMSCGMCDAHVNDLVRKNFNIKKVKANHSKGSAEIITEENITQEDPNVPHYCDFSDWHFAIVP